MNQDQSIDLLFYYLQDIIYNTDKAFLDIDQLAPEFDKLGQGLQFLCKCIKEQKDLVENLNKGYLGLELPSPENELAAPLKQLHASLRHLTWQTKQVAKGDYSQRIDFMGEFYESFNKMVDQLCEREKALKEESRIAKMKSQELEENKIFLETVMNEMPQWILVIDLSSQQILFQNSAASTVLNDDWKFKEELIEELLHIQYNTSIEINMDKKEIYLSVVAHEIVWRTQHAAVFIITDISNQRRQVQLLENDAYLDGLTGVYNRRYGMNLLNEWLLDRKQFCICFIDLDNLKFVNDTYGHEEGDVYINRVVSYIKKLSSESVTCRIGGDEFMLLAPNMVESECFLKMWNIRNKMRRNDYAVGVLYSSSMSYGIVEVGLHNNLSSSELLALADQRMYNFKRTHKKYYNNS